MREKRFQGIFPVLQTLVAGVAGPVRQVAAEHARHAAQAGADTVIALPPYLSGGDAGRDQRVLRGQCDCAGFLRWTGIFISALHCKRFLE